ncbi:MAG: D-alanyl-D-alanine carboxypeptidase/D-alanyl-D-alanine-endopeptidase [Bacteroidales bacterium]
MVKKISSLVLAFVSLVASGQEMQLEALLSDSAMAHSSVSLCIIDALNGETVLEYNPEKSLMPASIQKLVTSAIALELLGPDHKFKTEIGYTGNPDLSTGRLQGDIIIKGGGDPALGSDYFKFHYRDFLKKWVTAIRDLGIKAVDGAVIADDSYFDYQPVPAKWLWEDSGNYYGTGVYGVSVFDNTYRIHFRTTSGCTLPVITGIDPDECRYDLTNLLVASGSTDKGYVFAAPYSTYGWIAGSIPVNREDFILKAAITDPPLLLAEIFERMLDSAGIDISGNPSTVRLKKESIVKELTVVSETVSPPLSEIIEALNHESVNLIAETLVKEIGKVFKGNGTAAAGIEVISQFLVDSCKINNGMFIEDGSGLSPLNAINSRGMAELLFFMKNKGKHFNEFYMSLPEAGKEGTLRNNFRDPLFDFNLRAKSGSMTRVRSYAGFFRVLSGKELIFCIVINNYQGTSQKIITGIESILKESILSK